jgi:ATP-dependent RNA helicase RhlE
MYRQNFSRHSGGRKPFGAPRGQRGSQGVRRFRTFDPTPIINSIPTEKVVQEFIIDNTFESFGLQEVLLQNVKLRYKTPTPIQDRGIGPILEGKDFIGIANTGTGKTAAFLIPLISKVLKNRNEKVLIVAPTRELANQIKDELYAFTKGLGVYSALCIGGAGMGRQLSDLRRNPNFVIGTPGRLQDFVRTGNLKLSLFGTVVLDEADLMVDIGFIQTVKYLISLMARPRQSLFFSATIDGKVRDVLNSFVTNPVTVAVKTRETAENIEQKVIRVVDSTKKIDELHSLLITEEYEKVLIFGRTKRSVQKLSDELRKRGHRSDAIHGNKSQPQRLKTLEHFKRNVVKVLVATDVAARGLDIPNVSHVVNFDLPETREAYVHRIGRTGRADKKGIALTFVG